MRNLFYLFRETDKFIEYLNFYRIKNFKEVLRNEPLFNIEFIGLNSINLQDIDAMIVTSPISVEILIKNIEDLLINKEFYIIGNRAAEQLKNSGYNNIKFVAQNIEDLVIFFNKNIQELKRKKILYIRGNFVTLDIKECFINTLNIEELIIYKLIYKTKFSDKFTKHLTEGDISKVALFSYKSTEEFLKICVEKDLINYLKYLEIFLMNKKSAELLKDFCQKINIVNPEGLIKIIKNYLQVVVNF